jgi:hypothetical protein
MHRSEARHMSVDFTEHWATVLTEAATTRMFCSGRSTPVACSTARPSMPARARFGSSLAKSCHCPAGMRRNNKHAAA